MTRTITRTGALLLIATAASPIPAAAQALNAEDAAIQFEELQWQQCDVQRDVWEMPPAPGTARADELRRLRALKTEMHEAIQALELRLGGTSEIQPSEASALQAAAELIRQTELKEAVLYSRGTIEQWDAGSALRLEELIQDRLQAVRDRLDPAGGVVTCPEVV